MAQRIETCVVIGAGMSGLVCTKALLDLGITPITLEKSGAIGGLWNYNADPNVHSCYQGLKTNTHRDSTAFSGFPMDPTHYPDFPAHRQILQYFHDYAKHFNLLPCIRFNHEVLHLQPPKEGNREDNSEANCWKISVKHHDGLTQVFCARYVAVCNGHHWNPIWPSEMEIKGLSSFAGVQIHSHNYREAHQFTGKRVLIAGMGISGGDIINEVSQVASQIDCSSRRMLTSKTMGETKQILYHPALQEIRGNTCVFSDKTTCEVDAIIWCWGYRYCFPFLDSGLLEIDSTPSRVTLFEHVFPLDLPGIAFIGLPTVDGSLHPIAELQSKWFAKIAAGQRKLPEREIMAQAVKEWQDFIGTYHVKYRPMQVTASRYIQKISNYIHE